MEEFFNLTDGSMSSAAVAHSGGTWSIRKAIKQLSLLPRFSHISHSTRSTTTQRLVIRSKRCSL